MELRLSTARTTRDIDLSLRQHTREDAKPRILKMLQASVAADLGDCFSFTVGEPVADLDAAPYGGARFPVEARMDGRTFAKFHIDVGVGDPVIDPLEQVSSRDWLDFADVDSISFPAISREQQFAEKLHAYTLPRPEAENTRSRDLVDMLLLVRLGLDPVKTRSAMDRTFERRGTHKIPTTLAPPPIAWAQHFAALAHECRLPEDVNQAFHELAAFVKTATAAAPE